MSNKGNFVRLITLAAMSILGGAGLFFLFQYERDNGRVAAEMPESKARTDGAIAATQRDTANATASRDVAKKNNADATDTDGSAEVSHAIPGFDPAELRLAKQAFSLLSDDDKYQGRVAALDRLLSSGTLQAEHIAALEHEEVSRAKKLDRQKRIAKQQMSANGYVVDDRLVGKVSIVENQFSLYVNPENQRLLDDLGAIGGIESIAKIFPGQNDDVQGTPSRDRRSLDNWYQVRLHADADKVRKVVEVLNRFPQVGVAEAVFNRGLRLNEINAADINDPRRENQWHLDATKVPQAWAYLEDSGIPAGGIGLTVAVIDTGVDYTHPDLKDNMWVNPQEIPDNGIDDDNNGFVDDVHGVSVVSDSRVHSSDPKDDHGHGTHIAGVIAAAGGNGQGVVGIAHNAKVMAIKAGVYSGRFNSVDIAEALIYALENGADIINMSFGGYGRSLIEEDALKRVYAQAVLVAAAGNEGRANESACRGIAMYPAAYPWVLGVMASQETPNSNGDYLARFSNWDCRGRNGLEYEVMAPGSGIWGPLPNDQYSAWSGTSMAAPVVSGIAALVRAKFPDKATHTSRFVMGQVASTGTLTQALTPRKSEPYMYRLVNASEALQERPAPELYFQEAWVFDQVAIDSANDDDGSLDAGETVHFGLAIRNRWAKADSVTVTLSATQDPYVTFVTDAVNYGAVGSFNEDDNGIVYDADLLATGVSSPFVANLSADTPNNHVVTFDVLIEAKNGLTSGDSQSYTFSSTFAMAVSRGRALPSIIDSDAVGTAGGNIDSDGIEDGVVTLDSASLWIVDKPVLVAKRTTLKVSPGASIQFWSNQPDSAYTVWKPANIQVEGTFISEGSSSSPITLFPSSLFPERGIKITAVASGSLQLAYNKVTNSMIEGKATVMKYNHFDRWSENGDLVYGSDLSNLGGWHSIQVPTISGSSSQEFVGNRFNKLARVRDYGESRKDGGWELSNWGIHGETVTSVHESLFDNVAANGGIRTTGSVFLGNTQKTTSWDGNEIFFSSELTDLSESQDAAIFEPFQFNGKTYAILNVQTNNYWDDIGRGRLDFAAAFARHLDGYLYSISDKEEIMAVDQWLESLVLKGSDYFKTNYEVCEEPIEVSYEYCADYAFNQEFYVGLIRGPDGNYRWDSGEVPAWDWKATQIYYDPVTVKTEQGWDISADDLAHTNEAPAATIAWRNRTPFNNDWETKEPDLNNPNYYYLGYSIRNRQLNHPFVAVIELPGPHTLDSLEKSLIAFSEGYSTNSFTNNAILNDWKAADATRWLTIKAPQADSLRRWNYRMALAKNFWGGAGESLVEMAVTDFYDDFNLSTATYLPILSEAPESAYPFVVDVKLTDSKGNELPGNKFGNQESFWEITFNRDMNQDMDPVVSFGPVDAEGTNLVPGQWRNARVWEGSYRFTPDTGDGNQRIRVVGGVAAANDWLVTGDDVGRFSFEIVTSGAEALTLQASGGLDEVALSWSQDDFELLHGFNLYRSLQEEGAYERINKATLDKSVKSFIDNDVSPGIEHYYYFTVVSENGESPPSNIALAAPTDTIAPTLVHVPQTVAKSGENFTLRADVSDNTTIASVTLYFRLDGQSEWASIEMVSSDGMKYVATIQGTALTGSGLSYYLEAKDSRNTANAGSAEAPNAVLISIPSQLDSDGDGVLNAVDVFPFDPNESVDTDQDGIGDNADTDLDGDGVDNLTDLFPSDNTEYQDSDADGIGNNADTDDDNDGVADATDAFPEDARGYSDSDADGMADEWEAQEGLNPNSNDADFDADRDGVTNLAEYKAGTRASIADGKAQIVAIIMPQSLVVERESEISLVYDVSDGQSELTGLGMRLHYDSAVIESLAFVDVLPLDLIAFDTESTDDWSNYDGDWRTDKYVSIAWGAISTPAWPGALPKVLTKVRVKLSSESANYSSTSLRLTATSTSPGYLLSSDPATAKVIIAGLDVDLNGSADALSDGLLILRTVFGFGGDALVAGAVANDAVRAEAGAIKSYVEDLSTTIDVDGNGSVEALTDGLLIIRYMFGFRGDALILGAIGDGATRPSAATIEAYLGGLM